MSPTKQWMRPPKGAASLQTFERRMRQLIIAFIAYATCVLPGAAQSNSWNRTLVGVDLTNVNSIVLGGPGMVLPHECYFITNRQTITTVFQIAKGLEFQRFDPRKDRWLTSLDSSFVIAFLRTDRKAVCRHLSLQFPGSLVFNNTGRSDLYVVRSEELCRALFNDLKENCPRALAAIAQEQDLTVKQLEGAMDQDMETRTRKSTVPSGARGRTPPVP